MCHENCMNGCSGPGAHSCVACKDLLDGSTCVKDCPVNKYVENGECKQCHEYCLESCNGPENSLGPNGCDQCKITKDESFCVKKCPNTKYDDIGTCKGNLIFLQGCCKNFMYQNNYSLKFLMQLNWLRE